MIKVYEITVSYYDSVTARFISEDTYRGEKNDPLSLNLYTYCLNNPIIYDDPSGHSSTPFAIGKEDRKAQGTFWSYVGKTIWTIITVGIVGDSVSKGTNSNTNSSSATPASAPVNPAKSTNNVDGKTGVKEKDVNPKPGCPPQQVESASSSEKVDLTGFRKYTPKELDKMLGSNFHGDGGAKKIILVDVAKEIGKKAMDKLGKNPDIYINKDGIIAVVSTVNKAVRYVVDNLNIKMY